MLFFLDASKNQIRRPRAASPKPTLPNNTSSDMLKQKNKARSYENLVEDSDQPSLNDKTSKQLKNEYANTDLKSKPSENKSSEVFASDPKPTLPVKPARKTPHGAKTVPSEPLDNWTPTKPQQVNNYENAFPNNPPPKPKRRMGSPVDTTDSIDLVDSPIPLLETDILQPQKADYEPSEAEKPEENCNLVRSSPHVKPALKKTFSSEKQLLVKKDSSSSNSSFPLPTDSNFHNSNSRDQKVSVGKLIDFDDDDDDLNSEVAENVDNAYGVVWKESKEVTSRPGKVCKYFSC